MSVEENKAILVEFFELFSDGRYEDAVGILAEDATWTIMGRSAVCRFGEPMEMGRFLEDLKGLRVDMPSVQLRPKGMVGEGDLVAVEAESHGVHKSGKTYNNKYHFLFGFRANKIAFAREYLDTLYTQEVLVND